MNWREQIENVGVNKIAKAMGVKFPTVYRYVAEGSTTLPREKSKALCDAMQMFLSSHEHKRFKQSLSDELVGARNGR